MARGYALVLLSTLLLLLAMALCAEAQARAAAGAAGEGDFAAQAADAIDNTLLTVKNSINSIFEDGSKLSSFFANVTTHFKKLTGGEKETT